MSELGTCALSDDSSTFIIRQFSDDSSISTFIIQIVLSVLSLFSYLGQQFC